MPTSLETRRTPIRAALGRSVAASIGFAGLYVVLALVSPTTTFHLGPAVVGAAGPIAAGRGQGPWPTLAGLGLAMVAVWLLHRLDLLAGPSLLPVGGAPEVPPRRRVRAGWRHRRLS